MSPSKAIQRIGRMDRDEAAFRIVCEVRKHAGRWRHAIARPRWRRGDLGRILDADCPGIADAVQAARLADGAAAHRALAGHFAARPSVWPLRSAERAPLVTAVTARFPDAVARTRVDADRIIDGRFDLLGYRDLHYGSPPDWHFDAVHRRRAPSSYWTSIAYLDPTYGDHKIIWELNRHQHWGALGRAWWLTGDERYRAAFVTELESWMAANQPLTGINWTSMLELGFRSMSWAWAVEFFASGSEDSGTPWLVDLLVGVDRQLEHVEQNLSRYFSPNTHLTGEALALYTVALAFPELKRSGKYAKTGRDVLVQETERQVRRDGGHAELSAHYHRYSTDFYLLATAVARAANDPAAAVFERSARAQAEYLRTIADDQGRLPLIGDDDGGQMYEFAGGEAVDASATLATAADLLDEPSLAVGPPAEAAYWILGHAPASGIANSRIHEWPSRVLPHSGYVVSRSHRGDHLIFDAGPHGFLNGGHAHSDALGIVLAVAGKPLIVDPGTATYTMDADVRNRFRSSRMHNTVTVDGRDHAEPRGPFHWMSRPDARLLAADVGRGVDVAQGTHDAYAAARHVRTAIALPDLGWLIVDQILGTGTHDAEAWWHVHPDWRATLHGSDVELEHRDGPRVSIASTASGMELMTTGPLALYAPEYGRVEPAAVLRTSHRGATPFAFATFIAAAHLAAPALELDEVTAPPPSGWYGTALTVAGDECRASVLVAAPADGRAPWLRAAPWGTGTLASSGRIGLAWTIRGGTMRTHAIDGDVRLIGTLASAVHNQRASGF